MTEVPVMTFGRYAVLRVELGKKKSGKVEKFAVCQCSCGSPQRTIALYRLKSGKSQSCGCRRAECSRTHGLSDSPEYGIWGRIKSRCEDTANPAYRYYGARGISLSAEFHDFGAFIEHVGRKPSPESEIDRINNNGNYERGNLRWTTRKEQMRNTRANHFLEFDGQSRTVAEWAERTGIKVGTLTQRLEMGWNTADVLTRPVAKTARVYHRKAADLLCPRYRAFRLRQERLIQG